MGADKIKAVVVAILVAFLSIYLGINAATAQSETVLKVVGVGLFLLCLFLGHRIWLLFIFFTGMNVAMLRGFGTTEIGQAAFLGFSILQLAVRKLRLRVTFGELEFWALMIILSIVQVFVRHPTGLNIMGASTVGGKPYILMAMTIASAALLSWLVVPAREIRWAARLTLVGGLIGIPTQIARGGFRSYEEGMARIPSFVRLSSLMMQWFISRSSPLRAMVNPFWGGFMLVCVAIAAASGYRSSVANVFLLMLFGVYYRHNLRGVFVAAFAGSLVLGLLAFINIVAPLPSNVQRALSPLPGSWEERYVADANKSTDWRVEMWKEALFTPRWIHNKILGDGMGFSSEQLKTNQLMTSGVGSTGLLIQQENMLINGSYHSGPVHSVRCVGYVGLVILVITMFRVMVHAHRLILYYRDTEWFPVVFFMCVPSLILPVYFLFIFGEYPAGVGMTMMGIAWIRLMQRNLPPPVRIT